MFATGNHRPWLISEIDKQNLPEVYSQKVMEPAFVLNPFTAMETKRIRFHVCQSKFVLLWMRLLKYE
jgi:hypothetical protein